MGATGTPTDKPPDWQISPANASATVNGPAWRSEDFLALFGRPAQADALVGLDQWALDQDRFGYHCVEHGIVARRGQPTLPGIGAAQPQPFPRTDPGIAIEMGELLAARRVPEV